MCAAYTRSAARATSSTSSSSTSSSKTSDAPSPQRGGTHADWAAVPAHYRHLLPSQPPPASPSPPPPSPPSSSLPPSRPATHTGSTRGGVPRYRASRGSDGDDTMASLLVSGMVNAGTPGRGTSGGGGGVGDTSSGSSSSSSSNRPGASSNRAHHQQSFLATLLFSGALSLAAVVVAALFVVGTGAYVVLEGLSLVDAMYLTTGVITTVGLVIVPRTPLGRAFTAVFNMVSLGIGALLLTEIAEARRRWAVDAVRRSGATAVVRLDVLALVTAVLPPLAVATLVFHWFEGWPLSESFYFCLITATGLGMGDVEPRLAPSRIFFMTYLWYTMGVMLTLMGTLGHVAHSALTTALFRGRDAGMDTPAAADGLPGCGAASSSASSGAGSGDGGGTGDSAPAADVEAPDASLLPDRIAWAYEPALPPAAKFAGRLGGAAAPAAAVIGGGGGGGSGGGGSVDGGGGGGVLRLPRKRSSSSGARSPLPPAPTLELPTS